MTDSPDTTRQVAAVADAEEALVESHRASTRAMRAAHQRFRDTLAGITVDVEEDENA